jgi:homocysteine S-methyltransferase|tara:strand:- start:1192 stop:2016 length:825 start_codon:yes stop_codon:yes gene_type:complete
MGTELMDKGVKLPLPLWSAEANINASEIVKGIHQNYVDAGADIITTNTFRTTTWSYRRAEYSPKRASERAKESLMKAIELARSVNPKIIAGSVTSINDCYEPDEFPGKSISEDSYGETLEWFIEAGINNIFLETMGHLEEIKIAIEASKDVSKLYLSLIVKDKDHLLSGHMIEDIFPIVKDNILCLMLNCNTIDMTNRVLNSFIDNWNLEWGVYPNLGLTKPEPDGEMSAVIKDDTFKKTMLSYIKKSPSIIGTCCGSSPRHIRIIRDLLKKYK